MFKNYLKIAIRNLWRQKTYSAINILGFAIGLSVCLVITFYVVDDLTYDRMHDQPENVYRLLTIDSSGSEGALSYAITAGPLVANLADNVPEIMAATRTTVFGLNLRRGEPGSETENTDQEILNFRSLAADASFFQVFSFPIIAGNRENPLADPAGVYLTSETARTLYGDENPVGKVLNTVNNNNIDFYVAGILADVPSNSHLQFGAIVPLRIEINPVWWDSWENLALIGYCRAQPGTDQQELQNKIRAYARSHGFAEVFDTRLQPLLDIHLGSNHLRYDYNNNRPNDRLQVLTLGIIALLVLIIASINFINLSSARAAKRAREVGMRKVIGGNRLQLLTQFLGESVLITLIAMFLALVIFELAIPQMNTFLNKDLSFNLMVNFHITLFIILLAILIGLLSGIYPALILAGFEPVSVLKGRFFGTSRGIILRRILVIGQFAVSIALLCSVLIILDQLQFLNRVDLGYSRDDVVILNRFDGQTVQVMIDEIKNLQGVEQVGLSSNLPGGGLVRIEVRQEGIDTDAGSMYDRLFIDDGFIKTLEIEMAAGRNFNFELATDLEEAVIINETAVHHLGWADPLGKKISMILEDETFDTRIIVGVIRDINYSTARRRVNPMVLVPANLNFFPVFIKIRNDMVPPTIAEIEHVFQQHNPDAPFLPIYLDEFFNFQFAGDRNFATNMAVFSGLAILIACLGLLGLAAFAIQQRQKEIAVRKVLGSSMRSIVVLLTRDFTRWVLVANLIGWPLAYYGMNLWLQNFVYRTRMNFLIFLVAGIIAFLIAFLTVSFQTVKAAHTKPVEALKYE